MEHTHTQEPQTVQAETAPDSPVLSRPKKPRAYVVLGGAAVMLLLAVAFYFKGIFVAATVDGSPISRLSVIAELERQGGQQTLQAMIDRKIIQAELAKHDLSVTQDEIDVEMGKVEAELAGQGGTLDDALASQGMTKASLTEEIVIQKKMEKLFADDTKVTEEEIGAYIKENTLSPAKGQSPEEFHAQVSEQLVAQKFQQKAQQWLADLKSKAVVRHYVNY